MSKYIDYDMPYINNKAVYAAVTWAREMIREEDIPPGVAIMKAAMHYKVPSREVAHYVGVAASIVRARKRRR